MSAEQGLRNKENEGKKDRELSKISSELEGLRIQKEKIESSYRGILPKVDPFLIHDVMLRMLQDPQYRETGPFYTVEVFTKEGTDSQKCRDHIFATTGTVPAVYDNGTHYVTHMRLTPEILKRINDFEYVVEVMGDYTGSNASMGPQHSPGEVKTRYQDDDRKKDIS
jgi:hypothetical protein